MLFEKTGLLETYKPKGADALKPVFRDAAAPYTWTGMDAYLSVLCFNTVEGGKNNVATPTSWLDLAKPEYKGKIVMPHPASSGTGYLTVAAWMQIMGEKQAWEFMDKLHDNIAVYTHSGSAPCVQAAKGERMAGIGFDMRGAREKTQGAPIEIVLPKEGAGWELEATVDRQGHQEPRARQEGRRLGRQQAGERALFEVLRDRRRAEREEHPAELSADRRTGDGEERLRLDGGEPRPHPGRVVEALRVQGRAEELGGSTRSPRRRGLRPRGGRALTIVMRSGRLARLRRARLRDADARG